MYSKGDLTVAPEVGVQRWTESGVSGTQLYITPSVKYRISGNLYVDFGVGLSVFDRTDYGSKTISSSFQFADHVGIVYHASKMTFGVRYVHASNAGIKEPNPGMDSFQATISFKY
jgi:hypothetical protein